MSILTARSLRLPLVALAAAVLNACAGTEPAFTSNADLIGEYEAVELEVTENGVTRDLLAQGARVDLSLRGLGMTWNVDVPVAIDSFPPIRDSFPGLVVGPAARDNQFLLVQSRLGFFLYDMRVDADPRTRDLVLRQTFGNHSVRGRWRLR